MLLEQLLREKRLRLQHLAGVLPPVHELINEFKVPPGIAWALWRPVFQAMQPALAAQLAVSGFFLLIALGCVTAPALCPSGLCDWGQIDEAFESWLQHRASYQCSVSQGCLAAAGEGCSAAACTGICNPQQLM